MNGEGLVYPEVQIGRRSIPKFRVLVLGPIPLPLWEGVRGRGRAGDGSGAPRTPVDR